MDTHTDRKGLLELMRAFADRAYNLKDISAMG